MMACALASPVAASPRSPWPLTRCPAPWLEPAMGSPSPGPCSLPHQGPHSFLPPPCLCWTGRTWLPLPSASTMHSACLGWGLPLCSGYRFACAHLDPSFGTEGGKLRHRNLPGLLQHIPVRARVGAWPCSQAWVSNAPRCWGCIFLSRWCKAGARSGCWHGGANLTPARPRAGFVLASGRPGARTPRLAADWLEAPSVKSSAHGGLGVWRGRCQALGCRLWPFRALWGPRTAGAEPPFSLTWLTRGLAGDTGLRCGSVRLLQPQRGRFSSVLPGLADSWYFSSRREPISAQVRAGERKRKLTRRQPCRKLQVPGLFSLLEAYRTSSCGRRKGSLSNPAEPLLPAFRARPPVLRGHRSSRGNSGNPPLLLP